MQIYVDADACPVKDEAAKVAARHDLVITYVSNSHALADWRKGEAGCGWRQGR
jgi:uncharacterized protein YaiI (UPF0178 family)